jgi:methylated-DNA-[protein]-cysteine S-methyltransferase
MTAPPSPTPAHAALARRTLDTPIGPLHLVASGTGLRAVLWPGEDGARVRRALAATTDSVACDAERAAEAHLDRAAEAHLDRAAEAHLDRTVAQLAEYFAGARRVFTVALDPVGTPFQRRAWHVLRAIPYAATISYREQAAALGDPGKARAVGAANARNPLSIVVPCHRVVASSGALTGFAGGLATKRWLLAHETRLLAAG